MADPTPGSLSIATRDQRMRVEFFWHHDRFAHRVLMDETEVGISIEGGGEDPWPTSPPIQQLSLEAIGGTNVLLGVGAAGRSHWSISVEVRPDSSIKFDLASRCKDNARFLGSTYRFADSIALIATETDATVEEQDSEDACTGFRRVTIHPALASSGTHRWAYELSKKALI